MDIILTISYSVFFILIMIGWFNTDLIKSKVNGKYTWYYCVLVYTLSCFAVSSLVCILLLPFYFILR